MAAAENFTNVSKHIKHLKMGEFYGIQIYTSLNKNKNKNYPAIEWRIIWKRERPAPEDHWETIAIVWLTRCESEFEFLLEEWRSVDGNTAGLEPADLHS